MTPTPLRAQVADDGEKQVLLLLRERGGRLVHDDDARAGAERAGDFDELLLGHGERADLGVGSNLRADAVQELERAARAAPPSARAAKAEVFFRRRRDVFRDGEIGEERGLLIDAGDAELRAPWTG